MTQVTRREAVRAIAAGAAVAGAGWLTGTAVANAMPTDDAAVGSDATIAVARRSGVFGEPRAYVTARVRVGHCRSWDSSVYLLVDSSTHGFVRLSPQGFAIAAAAQAAGRSLAARCWGYEATADGGVGRFEGAHVAFDELDFPDLPGQSTIG